MGYVSAFGRAAAICVIFAGIHFMRAPELQAAPTRRAVTDSGITSAVEEGLLFERECSRTTWTSAPARASSCSPAR